MTGEEERLVGQLLEYAVEMHSKELNDYHGDDAEDRGLAPEACTYCKTFEEVAKLLGVDLKGSVEAVIGTD